MSGYLWMPSLATTEPVSNFTSWDWGIVVVYLAATLAVGVYANRYIRDMADYIVAGRTLRSWISVATMLGSEIGLVTVMYTAQKGFTGGFAAFHIGLVAGGMCLIIGLTGFLVVPLRQTGVMTIPEFYGQRFGPRARLLGAILLAAAGVLNMGMFLKAGAIFLTGLTGLRDPQAVNIVMTVLLALVLTYTILGGMVSVVITDYIQFVILTFGLLASCWYAVNAAGWEHVVQTVQNVHGAPGFDPLDDAGFGPSYVVWMCFTFGLVSCAVWPTAVMRACAAESTQVVRRLYSLSSIGFMTRVLLPQFLGLCALTWLWQRQSGPGAPFFTADGAIVADTDVTLSALPVFLSQVLPTGVIGVIGAGMLAAFMSTHDSYLLCWASVMVEDICNPLCRGRLSMTARLRLARLLILLIGIFLLIWSLWYPMQQDMLDYMAVSGAIYFTGAFAVLLFGLYWKRASEVGALLALSSGACAVLGLTPVRKALGLTPDRLGFDFNEAHVGLGTTLLAIVLMVAGSLLFPDPEKVRQPSPGADA